MSKIIIAFLLCFFFLFQSTGFTQGLPFAKEGLEPILTRPDMVILVPNAGVVFVYRDKYGNIVQEEYYSVRVQDQGIGLCDDVGNKDVWLFTGGGLLLHREDAFPVGLKPYWRDVRKDKYGNVLPESSILHNEKSTRPKK